MAVISNAKPNPDHLSPVTYDMMPPIPIMTEMAIPTAATYYLRPAVR